ncbi:hypothetical protein NP233_g10944 [Leucocoprinus birnbaumii]|uniref:Uncharacterized protein n=1 Tax=Leucocoprinus birnbaumii TaxID=56174 RepID=A0AAD5VHG2_9AGAR|nr:hypothetical protein NP233_g10944 [Leucocoprinus birnbaumii]
MSEGYPTLPPRDYWPERSNTPFIVVQLCIGDAAIKAIDKNNSTSKVWEYRVAGLRWGWAIHISPKKGSFSQKDVESAKKAYNNLIAHATALHDESRSLGSLVNIMVNKPSEVDASGMMLPQAMDCLKAVAEEHKTLKEKVKEQHQTLKNMKKSSDAKFLISSYTELFFSTRIPKLKVSGKKMAKNARLDSVLFETQSLTGVDKVDVEGLNPSTTIITPTSPGEASAGHDKINVATSRASNTHAAPASPVGGMSAGAGGDNVGSKIPNGSKTDVASGARMGEAPAGGDKIDVETFNTSNTDGNKPNVATSNQLNTSVTPLLAMGGASAGGEKMDIETSAISETDAAPASPVGDGASAAGDKIDVEPSNALPALPEGGVSASDDNLGIEKTNGSTTGVSPHIALDGKKVIDPSHLGEGANPESLIDVNMLPPPNPHSLTGDAKAVVSNHDDVESISVTSTQKPSEDDNWKKLGPIIGAVKRIFQRKNPKARAKCPEELPFTFPTSPHDAPGADIFRWLDTVNRMNVDHPDLEAPESLDRLVFCSEHEKDVVAAKLAEQFEAYKSKGTYISANGCPLIRSEAAMLGRAMFWNRKTSLYILTMNDNNIMCPYHKEVNKDGLSWDNRAPAKRNWLLFLGCSFF